MKLQLNDEQQQASIALRDFLSSPDPVFVLQGAGGTGKTQLLRHLQDVLFPQHLDTCRILRVKPHQDEILFTAMTNKAAEAMSELTGREACTLHSALGLKVEKNYSNGTTRLVPTPGAAVVSSTVIVVDEASMLDGEMLVHLRARTCQCKWIFVGDPNQLPPIKSVNGCPAFTEFAKAPQAVLTKPVRNATQPALMALCEAARATVTSLDFSAFKNGLPNVPGVIIPVSREELEPTLLAHFADPVDPVAPAPEARVLGYTNERVLEYNQWIQKQTGAGQGLDVGALLVNNRAFKCVVNHHGKMLPVERLLTITEVGKTANVFMVGQGESLRYHDVCLQDVVTRHVHELKLPEDPEQVLRLLKHYRRLKNWKAYYQIEETFPDLRPFHAATSHKAQGSTYKRVLVDLEDLGYCTNPKLLARLLYVAVSRASECIYAYGQLPARLFAS